MVRALFVLLSLVIFGLSLVLSLCLSKSFVWLALLYSPLFLIGLRDMLQTRHAILRNFPVLGHGRYLMEKIRPEINQYFVESNTDGQPFSRELRSIVYQRAKDVRQTLPFGTRHDVYVEGYEWFNHSLSPKHVDPADLRVTIGVKGTAQRYSASIFNIGAMSYGSLSKNAIKALNGGAQKSNFAHNTGEGGVSPYHLSEGGDVIYQIGTGYFGCRSENGGFDADRYRETMQSDAIKMIELKLSQGAKPGHGGILPAAKITPEISQIRGVPMGQDVLSPPSHKKFNDPRGLLHFIEELRELSGRRPVGFKLCVGHPHEFLSICKAMIAEKIFPDFICVDGGEGGTGAAPLEFSNHFGHPYKDGLHIVHQALRGFGLRDQIKVIASGRITTAFHILRASALGADLTYSSRAMMFALGCIQALECHSNKCPTGVATQDSRLVHGLDPTDKAERVANFHRNTVKAVAEMIGGMGLSSLDDVRPEYLWRRISMTENRTIDEFYPEIPIGALLKRTKLTPWAKWLDAASADHF